MKLVSYKTVNGLAEEQDLWSVDYVADYEETDDNLVSLQELSLTTDNQKDWVSKRNYL